MNDKITVCLGKGGQREMAESFARKNNVPIMDKPGERLTPGAYHLPVMA